MRLRTSAVAGLLAAAVLSGPAGARADEPRSARAEEPRREPRYELLLSPTLDAESGARLVTSAVTATGSGEERLFRGLEPGPAAIVLRAGRTLVWDAPVAWWYGVALHEAFGHGGRGREFHTSPGVHLGSPWGGRDSYASFDLDGTSSEERLHIFAGGTEANTLAASFLERRAVEGVAMRPIELLYLASNRLVASDYVLRTTPDPGKEPARFHAEYLGGGDVANYLGLLHEMHVGGSGITAAAVDATIEREYRRLSRQARWNLLDPGLWWALASALRQTARGDTASPFPLPRAGRFRFLPVLSSEWTPSGGQTSLEWILAPVAAGATPRTFSFVARRGAGPAGAFGALGATAEDLFAAGPWALGGAAEIWHDPRGGPGAGARLRFRLARGYLGGLYFDVGAKSQGYWIGQPASPGAYAAVGILLGLLPRSSTSRLGAT